MLLADVYSGFMAGIFDGLFFSGWRIDGNFSYLLTPKEFRRGPAAFGQAGHAVL